MRARIERADIEKLAALARLKLGNAEVEALARDVESILAYVSKLPADVPIAGREKASIRNVMREDSESHEAGAFTDAILANAPRKEDSYIIVKKILNRD